MIYIVTHKRTILPEMAGYIPIHVGAKGKDSIGLLRDDMGENISEKNPFFCELTGLYWIWKNTDDDYKGIVHYRRFFGRNTIFSRVNHIYPYDYLMSCLSRNDVVVSFVEHFKQCAHDELLINCCSGENFKKLRDSVFELYPEYINDFDDYFSQNKSVLFNMIICKSCIYDNYCQWLFDILFNLERKISTDELDGYQRRLFGFLGERLMNVWIMHNGLKAKHLPVINTEMNTSQKLQVFRRRYTNELTYSLMKMVGGVNK